MDDLGVPPFSETPKISDVLCEIHQDVWAEEELGRSRLFKSH